MRWETKGTVLRRCAAGEETEASIPSGITEIGMEAFSECRKLEKIEIPDSVKKIGPFAFSRCQALRELTIPDSVKVIGEGAFRWCPSLSRIVIGRSVTQVGANILDGCAFGIDIVWLAHLSYKTLFYKILPPFSEIRGLCAPFKDWKGTEPKEKVVLSCGYCFHEELESCYPEETRTVVRDYIERELPASFNLLCEKNCIYEVFLACYGRKLIREPEGLRHFISYVRTRKTSREEKKILDEIAEKEGLLERQKEQDEANKDKDFLRRIAVRASESVMRQRLAAEGLTELPAVRYRESGRQAPAEALKYIIYAYLEQWPSYNVLPVSLKRVREADEIADMLNQEDLARAWEEIGIKKAECSQTSCRDRAGEGRPSRWVEAVREWIRYPGRLLPILRFATEETAAWYLKLSGQLADYEVYGQDGYRAVRVIEKAILLNSNPSAVLFAEIHGLSGDYALLHGRRREKLRVEALDWLARSAKDRESIGEIQKQFEKELWSDYLSGRRIPVEDWVRFYVEPPFLREVSCRYVWELFADGAPRRFVADGAYYGKPEMPWKQVKDFEIRFMDSKGSPVFLDPRGTVGLAHPAQMSQSEIREWQACRENAGTHAEGSASFCQLWLPSEIFFPEDWKHWFKRYEGIEIPVSELRKLCTSGFILEGLPEEGVQLLFRGKCMMVLKPSPSGNGLHFGEVQKCSMNLRELNQALAAVDDLLCYDLIRLGRVNAAPFLERLNEDMILELLDVSVEIGHKENAASLLNYRDVLRAAKAEREQPMPEEKLELDW